MHLNKSVQTLDEITDSCYVNRCVIAHLGCAHWRKCELNKHAWEKRVFFDTIHLAHVTRNPSKMLDLESNVYQINHFEIKLCYFLISHKRQHVNGNVSKLYLLLLLSMRESGYGGNHFYSSSCHKQHGCCALGASSNALQRAWRLCGSCWAAHLMQLFWEWEC